MTTQYTYLFENDEEYVYSKSKITPEKLATHMTTHLKSKTANKDGKGIKNTCKKLGISYTYKAIQEYLDQ